MTERVVIVGAGISGLAAAHEAQQRGFDTTVIEASPRAGGKIDSGFIDGADLPFPVDMAADGFLARQPEVVDLCHEIGLGEELVAPSSAKAFVWANGALRRIPSPSVLGVPLDIDAVAASGIVSRAGIDDLAARIDVEHAPLTGDTSVGDALRSRVGREVFEKLVDPLLGGINAGNADSLSIEAGAPQLAEALRAGGSLRTALREQVDAAQAAAAGPVFNGVKGGTYRIIASLAERLGERLQLNSAVTALHKGENSWTVTAAGRDFVADRVVLATPAWVTAGLLAPLAADAAKQLADLEYGSAVLVTFVVNSDKIADPLDGAGFLVPRSEGLLMTACSWSSSKWDHFNDGSHAVLRVSAGRTDDARWLGLEPEDLIAQLRGELAETIGLAAEPIVRITPWRQALPQYRPGHLERCDAIDEELNRSAPGVVVTGAQMRGLGLPACVRQGRAACSDSGSSRFFELGDR